MLLLLLHLLLHLLLLLICLVCREVTQYLDGLCDRTLSLTVKLRAAVLKAISEDLGDLGIGVRAGRLEVKPKENDPEQTLDDQVQQPDLVAPRKSGEVCGAVITLTVAPNLTLTLTPSYTQIATE